MFGGSFLSCRPAVGARDGEVWSAITDLDSQAGATQVQRQHRWWREAGGSGQGRQARARSHAQALEGMRGIALPAAPRRTSTPPSTASAAARGSGARSSRKGRVWKYLREGGGGRGRWLKGVQRGVEGSLSEGGSVSRGATLGRTPGQEAAAARGAAGRLLPAAGAAVSPASTGQKRDWWRAWRVRRTCPQGRPLQHQLLRGAA